MSKYQPYPSYKDSGVEWLGDVPEHWFLKAIKYVASCNDEALNESTADEAEINYVEISGVSCDRGIHEVTQVAFKDAPSRARRIVQKEDVIVSTVRTYLKSIAQVKETPENLIVSTGFAVIRPRAIESSFLGYLFHSEYLISEVISRSVGISYPAINASDLIRLKLPVPVFEEQSAIANFLDQETGKMDLLIEKQQTMIALLKEKRQAVISHAVTKGIPNQNRPNTPMKDSGIKWLGQIPKDWELSNLRYIFKFGKGLTITKANLQDKGVPCVSYGEVHSRFGFEVSTEEHHLKCVSKDYLDTSKFALLKQGDFVFADTSEDLDGAGNFTHVSSSSPIFAGYHTIIAKQIYQHNYRFLAYLMDSIVFRTQIQLAVKGVKVFSITQAILRAATVWLPKIEEQNEIASYLDNQTKKIDTLIEKSQQAIVLLKERKTALISEAVTGKIDVRNPS